MLDELPPGRTPIVTRRISDERSSEVWEFVRKQVNAGHQAYVVYPVIEENQETELKAALKMYKELSNKTFADLKVGLLHGRLDPELKEQVMRMFQRGELNILVATTVIEVGVDVPNATVMVVEHAERFGLSQLHQLRGRIGRGAAKSFCVLMTGGKISEEGERRLDAMVRTNDGFEIAELDLELRGPGEFFGTRQAGMPDFRVANLIRDRQLLEAAKREAAAVVAGPNAEITKEERERAIQQMRARWRSTYGLGRSRLTSRSRPRRKIVQGIVQRKQYCDRHDKSFVLIAVRSFCVRKAVNEPLCPTRLPSGFFAAAQGRKRASQEI